MTIKKQLIFIAILALAGCADQEDSCATPSSPTPGYCQGSSCGSLAAPAQTYSGTDAMEGFASGALRYFGCST